MTELERIGGDGTAVSRLGLSADEQRARDLVGGWLSAKGAIVRRDAAANVFARFGVALPRETRDQYKQGMTVARRDVAPGDLVFFSTTARGASHVAIALGSDEFVHAPSNEGVVRVEHLSAKYWTRRFVGVRRLFRQP